MYLEGLRKYINSMVKRDATQAGIEQGISGKQLKPTCSVGENLKKGYLMNLSIYSLYTEDVYISD
jgi:hypothetical protein